MMTLLAPERTFRRLTRDLLWRVTLPFALLGLWWLLSSLEANLYFPALPKILATFRHVWLGSGFVHEALPSLRNLAIGYVGGTVTGIAAGVVVASGRVVSAVAAPLIDFARSLPPPALLPFAILALGIGASMKIGIIWFAVFFVVVLGAADGVRGVDATSKEVARSFRISWRVRLFRITLPAASPNIVAAMRTALSLGLLMMIVSEMVASTTGIGFFTLQAEQNFAYSDMWAGMLLLGVLGYLFNAGFDRFERRVLFWQARRSPAGPLK